MARSGPLAGVRVLELGGIGPGPFAAMVLGDLGADVTRIHRSESEAALMARTHAVLLRGRRPVVLDLKSPGAVDEVLGMVGGHDAVLEGFRPGVVERLGLGPEPVLRANPRIVYGRMTGWGQTGPLACTAGHDITYLALSGALEPICGSDGVPVPPLNMLGDFGGGAMTLAVGVLAALWHARATGEGQVVDASIVEGAALMTAMHHSLVASGLWSAPRGGNLLDGGAPFYGVYRTRDDRFVAVGALEPEFLGELLDGMGLAEHPDVARMADPQAWPGLRALFAATFLTRDRDEWADLFAGRDACLAPVLSPAEAARHPHLVDREAFVEVAGALHPSPTPRFSGTPLDRPHG